MRSDNDNLECLGNIAVLVVDIQNDFCHDDGAFAKQRGLNVQPAQTITPKIKLFIEQLRKYDIPIIYSKQIESAEVSPNNLKKQIESGKLTGLCAPNSWGSELYQLEPNENEYVFEKYTYDVFSNQRLDKILKDHEIDTLVITGVNTDICIDTTLRRAFTEGYRIVVPRDLVATMNTGGEKHYLKIFDMFFGTVTDSNNVLAYIMGQK